MYICCTEAAYASSLAMKTTLYQHTYFINYFINQYQENETFIAQNVAVLCLYALLLCSCMGI